MSLPERMADLRFRLERGDSLCLNEHTINRDEEDALMFWITCGDTTIDRVVFPATADPDRDIQTWTKFTMQCHRSTVAERIVGELLDELER